VIVTFLSDYGPGDEYAGIVVGVIARLCPDARVIELGHGVPPQDVRTGARRLARALPFVPAGVHLAVVDPGVGGPRRALALRTAEEGRLLVGPDNGLLVPAAERFGGVAEAVEISSSPWRLEPVSATFHGRDVFGPVAGRLAAGAALADAGEPLDPASLERLPELKPRREGEAVIVHVVEIDGFGNVMLDGRLADLPATATLGGRPVPQGRTFGDVEPGALLLYEDSSGGLALAVNGGSAAAALGVRTGHELRLEPA
jgi:S-adenosyl-L-methionine hydrolase (adenosine-forming)